MPLDITGNSFVVAAGLGGLVAMVHVIGTKAAEGHVRPPLVVPGKLKGSDLLCRKA